MYRSVIIAVIVLTATSTSLLAFFDLPQLSYGEVGSVVAAPAKIPQTLRSAIVFTGDVMLARRVETLLDRYGSSFAYERMPTFASSTDWVMVNFEAPVPKKHVHTPDLTFRFSVDAQHLSALRSFGVTHASLANNHTYDAGVRGYQESVEALRAADIIPVGDATVGSSTVQVLEIDGATVAVFALHAVDTTPNRERLAALMSHYASTTYQVAYIHWGSEYKETAIASTAALAKSLVSLGFDAIVGHHPHVVQNIELIDGVPVFYSLGNFIFDQYFSPAVQEGLLLRLTATADGLSFELMPHTSQDARSQPRPMNETERKVFFADLAAKSDQALYAQIMAGTLSFSSSRVANSQ